MTNSMANTMTREEETYLLAVLEWYPLEAPTDESVSKRAQEFARMPERQYQQAKAQLIAQKQREALTH